MIKIFKTKQMYDLRTSIYLADIERENVFILSQAGSLDFLFYVKNCSSEKKQDIIEENIAEIKKGEQEEVYKLFSKLYYDMYIKYKKDQKNRNDLFFVGKQGGRDWRKFLNGNKIVICHDEFTDEGIQKRKIRNYTTLNVDEEKVTITTVADSNWENNRVEINTRD